MSTVHTLGIADLRTIKSPDRIRTVLGSCIGVALYDTMAKVGGMVHVMLPASTGATATPGKFADTGIDALLEQLSHAGALRARLLAKIAGGAAMFGGETTNGIGDRNAEAVTKRLESHGIKVVGADTGGSQGRRMMLDPATGNVEVQIIGQTPKSI